MPETPLSARTTVSPLAVDRLGAAEMLGVSPGTIDNLRLRGELASFKIGARRLFDVEDLRRFIAARKTCAVEPGAGKAVRP